MAEISIGNVRYRVVSTARDGRVVAQAVRDDSGDLFGVECAGESEAQALDRLKEWLTWQAEHSAALAALQEAERAYHRTIAGSAFADPVDGPTPLELQRESLDAVERARVRLDAVRARRPQ